MYHSSLTRDDVKRGRNALIHGTRLPKGKSGGNAICWWYMKRYQNSQGEACSLGDQSACKGLGFQPRCSSYFGLCYIEYWEIRPKWGTVLSALNQCISQYGSWFGYQCSRGRILACVSKLRGSRRARCSFYFYLQIYVGQSGLVEIQKLHSYNVEDLEQMMQQMRMVLLQVKVSVRKRKLPRNDLGTWFLHQPRA